MNGVLYVIALAMPHRIDMGLRFNDSYTRALMYRKVICEVFRWSLLYLTTVVLYRYPILTMNVFRNATVLRKSIALRSSTVYGERVASLVSGRRSSYVVMGKRQLSLYDPTGAGGVVMLD